MANQINISKLIGDVNSLNESIKGTSKLMSQLITKQNTLNKELSTAKGLKTVNDNLNKTKKTGNAIEKEAEKIIRKTNNLKTKQAQSLKAITREQIRQNEKVKEQNRLMREQARADLGLKKRTTIFQGMTKSILAAGGAMLSMNLVMKAGKEIARIFFMGTQNSADRLRVKIAGLKAQFDALKDTLAILGDQGGDAIDKAETKTSKFLKAALMVAKVKFLGASKAVELEVIGLEAEKLERRLIKLERAEANLALTNAKRRREIQEFRLLAESDDKSYAERINALKKGTALELKIDKDRRDAQRERIAISLTEKEITDEQIEQIVKQGLALEDVGLTLTTEEERVKVLNDITKFYDDQTMSLAKQKKLLANINTLTDEWKAKNKVIVSDLKKVSDQMINPMEKALEKSDGLTVTARTATDELLEAIDAAVDDSPVSIWESILALDESVKAEFVGQFVGLGNTLFDLGQSQRERELEGIRSNYNAQILAAGDNAEVKERLSRELAREEAKIQREQAQSEKNQALFNIAVDTAANMAKFSYNPFLMGLIATTGILQAGIVASQPLPEIPGFFRGTESAPAGLAMVGERGRELISSGGSMFMADKPQLMDMKGGETVYNNADTERMLNAAIYKDVAVNGNEGVENRLDTLINKIANQPKEMFSIDADGFKHYLISGNSKTKYLNRKGRK
jgi:hypothetical protein